jgi:O-antigen ligase
VPDDGAFRVPTRRHLEFLAAFLVVVASVGWRRGEYFSGSLDPVVVAKGGLTVAALVLAFGLARSGPRRRLGTGSTWWLTAVLVCSVFGALTADHLRAGGIIAFRVALIGATVFFLLRAVAGIQVITDIATACGAVAAVAAVTGLSSVASGRLSGGIPAMSANELAMLAGVVVLLLAWRTVLGEARVRTALVGLFFLAVIWETGSRTVLLMIVAGVLVMAVQIRRPRVGLVVGALLGGAAMVVVAVVTGAVTAFLQRDGDGLSTVESRLIAWRDAVARDDGVWQELFGGGLSVKIIPVRGQYWDTQPLDSSWVSLLVQAGTVGVAVAACWMVWTLRGALRAPYTTRVLVTGLLVFLLGHSIMESGLFDATPTFLLFMAVSLLVEGGSRDRLTGEDAAVGVVRAPGAGIPRPITG